VGACRFDGSGTVPCGSVFFGVHTSARHRSRSP
jgi:hypothetical protein